MHDFNKIKLSLHPHWEAFETLFKAALSSSDTLISTIDAYLLNRPGKQLRPVLAILSAYVCGTPGPLTHAVAAVAEMLHTASLLHDDVADNADTRRGGWSVQKLFGAQASILLGDFWFARAFQLLLDYEGRDLLPLYAEAIRGLSEGELFQMEKAQTLDINCEEYYNICAAKTVSLFKAAMVSGTLSIPEKEAARHAVPVIEQIAYHMGMAFQISDDMLDYRPEISSGKPAYIDISESKITLPLLGALEQAGDKKNRPLVAEWIRQTVAGSNLALQQIIQFVDTYKGMEYAHRICRQHTDKADELINRLPPSEWRDYLLQISDTL